MFTLIYYLQVTELSEGMLAISSALKAQSDSLTARGVLLPAAYGVAGYFLAALQAAQGTGTAAGVGAGSGSWVDDVGSRDAASALVCDQNVSHLQPLRNIHHYIVFVSVFVFVFVCIRCCFSCPY